MRLDTSLDARLGQAWPGVQGTATTASPQGPGTAVEAGFGATVGDGSMSVDGKTYGVLSAGTISLALLVFIWWSLPR
jgi:hypothetical protein